MDKEQSKEAQKTENSFMKNQMDFKKIFTIALAVFITFCCCTLFFFVIYRYNGFTDYWKNLTKILQPFIIGAVLAYMLNPILKFIEQYALKFLIPRMKNKAKAPGIARGIAIFGSLLFLIGIIAILIAAVLPSIVASVTEIVMALPEEVDSLIKWINGIAEGDSEFADIAEEFLIMTSNYFENWIDTVVIPQAEIFIASITSGVITGVKFLLNIIIGLIVSVYIMTGKEKFAGQAKRIVYAMFKPVRANVIVDTVRKSNEIFGGFISGKILDSAIIGLLTYIVLIIMQMPDPILVAVIIGVTNIIPFFGPFIGAVPSFIVIVLQNPIQGIYFLIFIVILQQIDGNIIGPKILGNSTGLSAFWVVFAITVFGGLWGFIGMLLGVPLMAVIYYIVESIVNYLLKKRGIPVTEVDFVKLSRISRSTNQPEYPEGYEEKKENWKEETEEKKK